MLSDPNDRAHRTVWPKAAASFKPQWGTRLKLLAGAPCCSYAVLSDAMGEVLSLSLSQLSVSSLTMHTSTGLILHHPVHPESLVRGIWVTAFARGESFFSSVFPLIMISLALPWKIFLQFYMHAVNIWWYLQNSCYRWSWEGLETITRMLLHVLCDTIWLDYCFVLQDSPEATSPLVIICRTFFVEN